MKCIMFRFMYFFIIQIINYVMINYVFIPEQTQSQLYVVAVLELYFVVVNKVPGKLLKIKPVEASAECCSSSNLTC